MLDMESIRLEYLDTAHRKVCTLKIWLNENEARIGKFACCETIDEHLENLSSDPKSSQLSKGTSDKSDMMVVSVQALDQLRDELRKHISRKVQSISEWLKRTHISKITPKNSDFQNQVTTSYIKAAIEANFHNWQISFPSEIDLVTPDLTLVTQIQPENSADAPIVGGESHSWDSQSAGSTPSSPYCVTPLVCIYVSESSKYHNIQQQDGHPLPTATSSIHIIFSNIHGTLSLALVLVNRTKVLGPYIFPSPQSYLLLIPLLTSYEEDLEESLENRKTDVWNLDLNTLWSDFVSLAPPFPTTYPRIEPSNYPIDE